MRLKLECRLFRLVLEIPAASEEASDPLALCSSLRSGRDHHLRRRALWRRTVREIKQGKTKTFKE